MANKKTEPKNPVSLEDIQKGCTKATKEVLIQQLANTIKLQEKLSECMDQDNGSDPLASSYVYWAPSEEKGDLVKLTLDMFVPMWLTPDIFKAVGSDRQWESIRKYIPHTRMRSNLKEYVEREAKSVYDNLKKHIESLIRAQICFYLKQSDTKDSREQITEEFIETLLKRTYDGKVRAEDDPRIRGTKIKEILSDDEENSLKRLTLLVLVSIFTEEDNVDFQLIYDRIFGTTALKQEQKTEHITKKEMWEAGREWYMLAKEERFLNLDIAENIIPEAKIRKSTEMFDFYADSEGGNDTLLELIKQARGHVCLVGPGGVGKTSFLAHVMDIEYKEYIDKAQVPLFVELSKAPDTYVKKYYEDGSCAFIRHTIAEQLGMSFDEVQYQLTKRAEEGMPAYWLLLDGLNEVSKADILQKKIVDNEERYETIAPVIRLVRDEIHYLMTECPNTRIVLTSRYVETEKKANIQVLQLIGVKKDRVKEYLRINEVEQKRIDIIDRNPNLFNVLRIPLFLTMYAKLTGEDEILSSGEILHRFFHQKINELYYSERKRNQEIEQNEFDSSQKKRPASRVTAAMLNFIIDFILPEIAWKLVKNDEFHIGLLGEPEGITAIVERVLTWTNDDSVCGPYGRIIYKKDYTESIADIKDRLCAYLGTTKDIGIVAEGIMKQIVETLGIMYKDDNEYAFVHQNIRDYFAARYQINKLELATYIYSIHKGNIEKEDISRGLLTDWETEPLPNQLLAFIGEALGEKHNAPRYEKDKHMWEYTVPDSEDEKGDRNLIKRAFDVFRGRFDREDGYAVYNLFQILKLVREDLSGEDFTSLNMLYCRGNGYRLGNSNFAADINGALLDDEFFMSSGHTERIGDACFSPDGQYIATASDDGQVIVWDAKLLIEIAHLSAHIPNSASLVEFSPDGQYIAVAYNENGTPILWNAKTFEQISIISQRGHAKNINSISFSPDGKYFITASEDETVIVWSLENLSEVSILNEHEGPVKSAQYIQNGRYIITSSSDGTVKLWDAKTYKSRTIIRIEKECILCAKYSPDGKHILTLSGVDSRFGSSREFSQFENSLSKRFGYLASPGMGGAGFARKVRLWKTDTFEEVHKPNQIRQNGMVNSVNWSSDGRCIITASSDGTAVIWNVKDFDEVSGGELRGHYRGINIAQYSMDGKYIITASDDCTIKKWSAKTFQDLVTSPQRNRRNQITSLEFSNDGSSFITTSFASSASVWDAQSLQLIDALRGKTGPIRSVQYSPDNKHIVTGDYDGVVKFWDVESYQEISGGEKRVNRGCVYAVSYNNDGSRILTVSHDFPGNRGIDGFITGISKYSPRSVRVWDTEKLEIIQNGMIEIDRVREKHPIPMTILSAQYSPDGQHIVTSDEKANIIIWNAQTFSLEKNLDNIFREHDPSSGYINNGPYKINGGSAYYSPDQKHILAYSHIGRPSGEVWIINPETSQLEGVLEENAPCNSARYSPDGRYILTVYTSANKVKVWDADTFQHLGTLKNAGAVSSACFHPDNNYIVTVSLNGKIMLWNPETYECIRMISFFDGLDVRNVDCGHLHSSSLLSERVKGYLINHGAVIGESIEQRKKVKTEETQAVLESKSPARGFWKKIFRKEQ